MGVSVRGMGVSACSVVKVGCTEKVGDSKSESDIDGSDPLGVHADMISKNAGNKAMLIFNKFLLPDFSALKIKTLLMCFSHRKSFSGKCTIFHYRSK